VIVIEHQPDIIKCADYIIDIGPEAGKHGGEVVFAGTPEDLTKIKNLIPQNTSRKNLKLNINREPLSSLFFM
jgi:excinuclease UvrABC ATPase subunit